MSALDGIADVPLVPGLADDGRLDALRRTGDAKAAREKAAGELQTLFLTQLLRAMRRTIPENDWLPRSPARRTYEDAFDETVARALAQGDPLGLVQRLGAAPAAVPRGAQVLPPDDR